MTDVWKVHVVDAGAGNANLSNAQVALVPASALAGQRFPFTSIAATHQHITGGVYEGSNQPSAGNWSLIINASGMTPVVQALQIGSGTQHLTTTAPKGGQLRTVQILTSILRGTGDQLTLLTVRLFAEREFVWAAAPVGKDKIRFDLYANDRATELLQRGKTFDQGTLMTLLSGQQRARIHLLPAVGGGFVEVARRGLGARLSIVDFYGYLDTVGRTAPGRVREIGVFSHAVASGPIIGNTGDDPNVPGRLNSDTDGRPKDWNTTNTPRWAKMPAALHSSAFFQIWGCSATDEFHNGIAHANGPGDVFFHISFQHHHHPENQFILRSTPNLVKHDIDRQFRNLTTYASGAAQFVGRPVKAAPPGVGSSLTNSTPNVMSPDLVVYQRVYSWLAATFGNAGNATADPFDSGYIDYRQLAALPAVVFPNNQTGYHLVDMAPKRHARIRLGLRARFKSDLSWSDKITASATEVTTPPPLASKAKLTDQPAGGTLHIFRHDKEERAFLVDQNDHVYLLARVAGALQVKRQEQ